MLKIKLDGNSRLAKQYRLSQAALTIATRLENGERIHLLKGQVRDSRGKMDAFARVMKYAGYPRAQSVGALNVFLNSDVALPARVHVALADLANANDMDTKHTQERRDRIAKALRKFAQVIRNIRIGKTSVK